MDILVQKHVPFDSALDKNLVAVSAPVAFFASTSSITPARCCVLSRW